MPPPPPPAGGGVEVGGASVSVVVGGASVSVGGVDGSLVVSVGTGVEVSGGGMGVVAGGATVVEGTGALHWRFAAGAGAAATRVARSRVDRKPLALIAS